MSDMITAEEADFAWPVGGYAPGGYMCKCSTCGKPHMAEKRAWQCADCVIQRLHAQLADAKAAQAMVVERAAGVLDAHDCVPLVPNPNWPEAEQEGYRNAQLDVAGSWKTAIRALADTDGLALVQALRAERDEYKKLAIAGNLVALEMRTVEADRDAALTRLATAEAQVRAAKGLRDQVAYIAETPDAEGYEPGMWAINRARSAIAAYDAALAEVQADARREGGA